MRGYKSSKKKVVYSLQLTVIYTGYYSRIEYIFQHIRLQGKYDILYINVRQQNYLNICHLKQ